MIDDKAIYTHPSNINLLPRHYDTKRDIKRFCNDDFPICDTISLFGTPIYTNSSLPKTQPIGEAEFPTDGNWKFCEFEKKDEEWALALGIAKRKEEPAFFQFKMPTFKVDLITQDELENIVNSPEFERQTKFIQNEIIKAIYETYYSQL